jgi:hypothetical protein
VEGAGKATPSARRVLERSVEQAGFYEAGRDRLVMPGFVPQEESFDLVVENGGGVGGGTGGGEGKELNLDGY